MFGVYNNENKFTEIEYVPIEKYLSNGTMTNYCRYGGFICPNRINKADEIQKRKNNAFLTAIANDTLEEVLSKYNLYNHDEFRRFVKFLAGRENPSGSPAEFEAELYQNGVAENDNMLRDMTIKKYLGLLIAEGIVMNVPVYDAKTRKYKKSPSWYFFTDIGVARCLSGKFDFDTKSKYRYLIANKYSFRGYNIATCQYASYGKTENKTERITCNIDFVVSSVDFLAYENVPKKFVHVIEEYSEEEIDKTLRAFKLLKNGDEKIIVTSTRDGNVQRITDYCASFNKKYPVRITDIKTFLLGL